MDAKNIKGFFELLGDEDEVELPLAYAYLDEEDACHVAIYGDEEEIPAMILTMLLEYFQEKGEGASIEEYAESVKKELIRFNWEQNTEYD